MAYGTVNVRLVQFAEGWGLWRLHGYDHYLSVVLREHHELLEMRHVLEENALVVSKGPYRITDHEVLWAPQREVILRHLEDPTDDAFFHRIVREGARDELAFERSRTWDDPRDSRPLGEGLSYVVLASHREVMPPRTLVEHLASERARLARCQAALRSLATERGIMVGVDSWTFPQGLSYAEVLGHTKWMEEASARVGFRHLEAIHLASIYQTIDALSATPMLQDS